MKWWDYLTVGAVVLAACVYLVIYIRKEVAAKESHCDSCEGKSSFCNACGNKECSMSVAQNCKQLEGILEKKKKDGSSGK